MVKPSLLRHSAIVLCLTAGTAIAWAGETVIYQYDELGRLKSATQTGTVNNNVTTQLQYDPAGNRSTYSVAGSNGAGSGDGVPGGVGMGPGGGPPVPPPSPPGVPPPGPPPPSFGISDVSATEGSALVFTVTKTGAATASFSVNYATADGTGLAGPDYSAATGTLTFAAAEITKTVTVSTIDDSASEVAESMFVNLSGATGGATLGDAQGSGTINDNDVANNNPTTEVDIGTVERCEADTFDVTVNDTDADGDYPLEVISVTGPNGFSVYSTTTLRYNNAGQTAGTKIGTYTVRDSRGATAQGTLTIMVPSGTCD